MVSEFDVREELRQIEEQPMQPAAKARLLLGVSRRLKAQLRQLRGGHTILARDQNTEDTDDVAADRLRQRIDSLQLLVEHSRQAAGAILSSARGGSGDPAGPKAAALI